MTIFEKEVTIMMMVVLLFLGRYNSTNNRREAMTSLEAMNKTFRPGQFGIFTRILPGQDTNQLIRESLYDVATLQLKSIEWVDLGSQIMAVLFSSFRTQIYLSEWQLVFRRMFHSSIDADHLRENSKRVVRLIADARQLTPSCVCHLKVLRDFSGRDGWMGGFYSAI
jgi:hypothetical protein